MKVLYPSDLIVQDAPLYRCPECSSFWAYVELEEESGSQEDVIDYWFYTGTCPDCEG